MRKIIFDFNNIDKQKLMNESQENSERVKSNTEEIYEYIDEVMKRQKGKMGLGVHAIRKEKIKGRSIDKVLKKIYNRGMDIRRGSSVLATVSSLGVSSELRYHQREAFKNYTLGSERAENGVVVLVPTILEGNGKQLYVGFPGMDISAMGNNHRTTCILDQLCCGNHAYGRIPKEFILGHFKEENGKRIFQKNMSHFLEMTDEEKGIFIKGLADRLTEQQKQISEAVITGDMQKLEKLSIEMCGNKDGVLGENTVIQNAMLYLNRDREQDGEDEKTNARNSKPKILLKTNQNVKINSNRKSSKPKILLKTDQDEKTNTRSSKRKILLESYQDVKLSDLTGAKETLREGTKELRRNDEEKRYGSKNERNLF